MTLNAKSVAVRNAKGLLQLYCQSIPSEIMNVLLQKMADPRFFSASGRWTYEITEALTFPNLATAIFFCQNRRLFDVRLLLSEEGCPYNIPVLGLNLRDILSVRRPAHDHAA